MAGQRRRVPFVVRAAACAPVARPARVATEPVAVPAEWSDAHAIAALRAAPRARPFREDAVEGPMSVRRPDDVMRDARGQLARDASAAWWPAGALLAESESGRWLVWPGGAVAPADPTAMALAAHPPAEPSFDQVVAWC